MNLVSNISEKLKPVMAQLAPIDGLADMFERCFVSTLETTAQTQEDGRVFIITGDIEAMWLRDSTEQVLHYIRFAAQDEEVAQWLEKVIARQAESVLTDAYANAFNIGPNGRHGFDDLTDAGPSIWERKYELDSLCHVMLLAARYWETTGRTGFVTDTFRQSLNRMLDVIETEQHHMEKSPYSFQRFDCPPSDTLTHEGKGTPVAETGMSWSGFRPSDDACRYGYLIPANLFAVCMLEKMAKLVPDVAPRALKLAAEIKEGIEKYGLVSTAEEGEIYAFETDGMGRYNLMDDANIPSLLSLPYLGVCEKDDERYLRTRSFVLSTRNPYYHEGSADRGVGSPHTPEGYIWPIGLCIQGLTSCSAQERVELLAQLLTTHAGTCRMHESFDPSNPDEFTRSWFAWANSMFGELIYRMYEQGELESAVAALRANGIAAVV